MPCRAVHGAGRFVAESQLRMALLLLLLLCSGSSLAAAACSDAAACNYNGVCKGSVCECTPQWRGPACATLSVQPASQQAGFHSPHIPGPDVNVSSWGGSILLDETTGLWNMYSAEMINDWCAADPGPARAETPSPP